MKANKFILASCIIWQIYLSSYCQKGYNIIYNFNDLLNVSFDDIQLYQDKLYVIGNGFDMDRNSYGVLIAVFDTSGQLESKVLYFDKNGSSIIMNSPSRFFIDHQNRIVLPIKYFHRGNLGILIYNIKDKTFQSQEYDNDQLTIFPKDVMSYNGNYYLFGTIQRSNYYNDCYVIKTNSEGQFLWIKYFGDPPFLENYGGVFDNENGTFTVSASIVYYDQIINDPPVWITPWIFTIDTNGIRVNSWKGDVNDECTFAGRSVYIFEDKSKIVIGREVGEAVLEDIGLSHTISRLDSQNNCQWRLQLSPYNTYQDDITDLEYDSFRNDFLVAGHRYTYNNFTYTGQKVWIARFTPEGELLWDIRDTIMDNSVIDAQHYTSGMTLAPSGSIYLAGYVEKFVEGYPWYGWIAKMTPDGCMDTLCIITSTSSPDSPKTAALYPNPSNGDIHLPDNAVVRGVHNIQGKAIRFEQLNSRLELKDWSEGLYLIQYKQGDQLFVEKVLMIR